MRLLFLCFSVAITGCWAPDHVTGSGVQIIYKSDKTWWKPEQIDKQELHLLNGLKEAGLYPDAAEALSQVTAYIYPDKMPCPSSPTGYCNGLQDYTNIYVRDMGCPYNSAYTHELAHWIQQAAGVDDYNHEEKALWEIADSSPKKCD